MYILHTLLYYDHMYIEFLICKFISNTIGPKLTTTPSPYLNAPSGAVGVAALGCGKFSSILIVASLRAWKKGGNGQGKFEHRNWWESGGFDGGTFDNIWEKWGNI